MRFRELRSRRDVLLVAAGAAVLAVVAGVIWLMAGAEPGDDSPDEADILAGDAELDIDQPGEDGQPAGNGDPADGGGLADGSDVGSEDSGDGQSNRPPVIDSAGISSNGLTLTIDPQVSDPDGDDATVAFDVNGMPVDLEQACFAHDACEVPLDVADVGYESDVAVTIIATDSRGATTQETYSHTVEARTRVTFTFMEVMIDDPAACFSADDVRSLSYSLELSGAINRQLGSDRPVSEQIPGWRLVDGVTEDYVGEQPPPLGVLLSVTLEGIGTVGFAAPRQYPSNADEVLTHWRNGPCEYTLTYAVRFEST